MIREILKLGDPALYKVCASVTPEEKDMIPGWAEDLHDTLMEYRKTYGAGRAIAAPQIGIPKRLIYLNIDRPYIIVNPVLSFPDEERYQLMDDCMSFPGLMVRVERYRNAKLSYVDESFCAHTMALSGDLSELLQHEYDHLDGILATMRAINSKSFYMQRIKRIF